MLWLPPTPLLFAPLAFVSPGRVSILERCPAEERGPSRESPLFARRRPPSAPDAERDRPTRGSAEELPASTQLVPRVAADCKGFTTPPDMRPSVARNVRIHFRDAGTKVRPSVSSTDKACTMKEATAIVSTKFRDQNPASSPFCDAAPLAV